ncbi:hypothetical protein Tdes44962_MAKER06623 [Teratosphaeria destructans]|uniref:Uncharacterized protein n=1 Tax=Teratosphaeria destructans TaxID=418781 RepID=A0A9W7W704_9PEZI|nr:hypothetical protein Tdes44962_MAKER06623 [Teratosphaeria destructans]
MPPAASVKRRRMQTAVTQSSQHDLMVASPRAMVEGGNILGGTSSPGMIVDGGDKSWIIGEAVQDKIKEALHDLEVMWKQKHKRIEVLKTLSNPWPHVPPQGAPHKKEDSLLKLPEANAALIPHHIFRKKLSGTQQDNMKAIRLLLRVQLLRCERPEDIQRIVATALVMGRSTQLNLSALHEPIMRALYRCRNNVSDTTVLETLGAIHSRFKIYNMPFSPQLLSLGLKFAARTRSLKQMKKYLKAARESSFWMSSNIFRSIIAKFSIGHRGLGEIRNGRWKRHELLQVCTGFPECDHLPLSKQYHLGVWLDRNDWQYLHGWIAVLARCKDVPSLWNEWLLWQQNPGRHTPKALDTRHALKTTKMRGDYWFLEQMAYAGGLKEAWAIFEKSGLPFRMLKDRTTMKMLEGIEYCTRHDKDILQALLRKYDHELGKMETALGVRWVPPLPVSGLRCVRQTSEAVRPEGQHVEFGNQGEVFERLSVEGCKLEEDHYGYPHDVEQVMDLKGMREEGLHEADEMGPA